MNCQMWKNPALQRNVAQLRKDGVEIIDPEEGWLSCGATGPGRMAALETIVEAIRRQLKK